MIYTDSQLLTAANVIKNETTTAANTATRVGTMLDDLITSKINSGSISTNTNLGLSDNLVPSQLAVKTYVDNRSTFPYIGNASITGNTTLIGNLSVQGNTAMTGSQGIQGNLIHISKARGYIQLIDTNGGSPSYIPGYLQSVYGNLLIQNNTYYSSSLLGNVYGVSSTSASILQMTTDGIYFSTYTPGIAGNTVAGGIARLAIVGNSITLSGSVAISSSLTVNGSASADLVRGAGMSTNTLLVYGGSNFANMPGGDSTNQAIFPFLRRGSLGATQSDGLYTYYYQDLNIGYVNTIGSIKAPCIKITRDQNASNNGVTPYYTVISDNVTVTDNQVISFGNEIWRANGRAHVLTVSSGSFLVRGGASLGTDSVHSHIITGSVNITGSVTINDILTLTTRTTTPANPVTGSLMMSGSSGANLNLYVYTGAGANAGWAKITAV
jgi:hypothetical protein